jgi:hypothetical protein
MYRHVLLLALDSPPHTPNFRREVNHGADRLSPQPKDMPAEVSLACSWERGYGATAVLAAGRAKGIQPNGIPRNPDSNLLGSILAGA